MELGIYSFGDVQRDQQTGERGSTAEATRNLLEAIRLADEVDWITSGSASITLTMRRLPRRPSSWVQPHRPRATFGLEAR
jgi:hypothetical protein